jgi:hypothetical protein
MKLHHALGRNKNLPVRKIEKTRSSDIGGLQNARFLVERITVRIPAAVAMTGLSRSRIYELIKSGELQIAKDGSSTLILVASLKDAISRRRLPQSHPQASDG